jgi:hypothetical protein
MKMARAFMASIPLALALVAAVAVPIALTPGTFGFHRWPADRAHGITDRPVRIAPEQVAHLPARAPRPVARAARLIASAPAPTVRPQTVTTTRVTRPPVRTGGRTIGAPAGPSPVDPPRGNPPAGPAPVDPPSPAPQPAPQAPTQSVTNPPAPTVVVTVDLPVLRAAPPEPAPVGDCGRDEPEQPPASR